MNKIINIENGYSLLVEDKQYTLRKHVGLNKKGKDMFKVLGYFTTIPKAYAKYFHIAFKERLPVSSEIKEVIKVMEETEEHIKTLIEKE